MSGGMTLDGVDVVIVDELQNLAEEGRGPRLEMLLTTIRANYKIPLIGLSATLSPQAIEDVGAWLGIDGQSIVTTRMRPVPLDYIVCDDSQAMVRTAGGAEASRSLDLRPMLRDWRNDAALGSRLELGQVKTYRRALALAATLLRGDGGMDGGPGIRSVLCFVGSREDAQRMAEIAQTVLDHDLRTPPVDPGANPFKGRFSDLSDDDAKQRYRNFQRYPQSKLRDSVAKSLRTGVGYHTARLDPEMRAEMEEAFRIGLVRLLFATDTLKLGINLPADAVVIASITTPTGEARSRVLNQIDVFQRLGRAGRLGYGPGLRGYGYLVVPEQRPAKTRVVFEENDLLGLAEMVQPATTNPSSTAPCAPSST
jgi:superfamily II RNA helicase